MNTYGLRIIALGFGLILLYPLCYGAAEISNRCFILYHAEMFLPEPAEVNAPAFRPVTFGTSDGLELTSWFTPAAKMEAPMLLFFMGDTGSIAAYASEFEPYLAHGYGILLLGYRGFGGNPGTPGEQGLYRDGRAAMKWLNIQGYGPDRIAVYGHSLGTGIAVQMALEYPVRAVILEAPYTTLPDTVTLDLPFIQPGWFMHDKYDNLGKIAAIKSPILIIQGEADQVIPVGQGKKLCTAALASKECHFIPEAGHTDLYEYGEAGMVSHFLEKLNP